MNGELVICPFEVPDKLRACILPSHASVQNKAVLFMSMERPAGHGDKTLGIRAAGEPSVKSTE